MPDELMIIIKTRDGLKSRFSPSPSFALLSSPAFFSNPSLDFSPGLFPAQTTNKHSSTVCLLSSLGIKDYMEKSQGELMMIIKTRDGLKSRFSPSLSLTLLSSLAFFSPHL